MNIVDKIKKVLVRAQGTTEEAATAAALAREMMTKYRIEEADLSLSQDGAERVVEKVEDSLLEDAGGLRAQQWRVRLAGDLARAFTSRIYYRPGTGRINVVGRPSDAQTVRYLHGYLCLEIARLAEDGYRKLREGAEPNAVLPRPSIWKDSFRVGAIDAISERLREQQEAERRSFQEASKAGRSSSFTYDESGPSAPTAEAEEGSIEDAGPIPMPASAGTALAIVRVDEERVEKEIEQEFKRLDIRSGRGWSGRVRSSDGYSNGQQAGSSIRLGSSGRGLPASAKRIS